MILFGTSVCVHVACGVLCVAYYVSCVIWHVSHVVCLMLCVVCRMLCIVCTLYSVGQCTVYTVLRFHSRLYVSNYRGLYLRVLMYSKLSCTIVIVVTPVDLLDDGYVVQLYSVRTLYLQCASTVARQRMM